MTQQLLIGVVALVTAGWAARNRFAEQIQREPAIPAVLCGSNALSGRLCSLSAVLIVGSLLSSPPYPVFSVYHLLTNEGPARHSRLCHLVGDQRIAMVCATIPYTMAYRIGCARPCFLRRVLLVHHSG
jgi:hypothetical protein